MLDDADRSRIAAELQRRIEARPEIVFAYLHGSFVSGGPYRDVDVAVWVDPAREPDHRTRYAPDLGLVLERGLAAHVDVQALKDAPLAFRYHAMDGRLLFTRDEEFLDELRARTWDEYFDFAPLARQYLRDALGEKINLDRLRELAGYLLGAVRELRKLGRTPREVFLANSRTVNGAKYLLIVATEAALDICNHIAARRGGRSPRDYADCLAVLREIGAVGEGLAARLARMARFRNLLVHLYWRVDDAEIYRVIQEDLDDLEEYLQSLGRFLKADLERP